MCITPIPYSHPKVQKGIGINSSSFRSPTSPTMNFQHLFAWDQLCCSPQRQHLSAYWICRILKRLRPSSHSLSPLPVVSYPVTLFFLPLLLTLCTGQSYFFINAHHVTFSQVGVHLHHDPETAISQITRRTDMVCFTSRPSFPATLYLCLPPLLFKNSLTPPWLHCTSLTCPSISASFSSNSSLLSLTTFLLVSLKWTQWSASKTTARCIYLSLISILNLTISKCLKITSNFF